jgi:surface antigen
MRVNRQVVLVVMTVIAALALTAPAQGAIREHVRVATPAGGYVFKVNVTGAAGSTCGLLVRAPRTSSQSMPFLIANKRGQAGWSWSGPRSVPKGRWHFTVRCKTKGQAHTRTAVRRLGHGRSGSIGDPSSFRVLHGTLETPTSGADPKGLGGDPNPFPWHQCTWWAWVKRSDVYSRARAAGVPAGGPRGVHQGQTVYVWDGARWFYNAQKAGIPTGQTPVVGALVGWDETQGNPFGHVAYVEAVRSATDITISECNGFTLVCGSRAVNPTVGHGPLEGYIYGGPAPDPGGPPVQPPPPAATPKLAISGTCTTNGGTLVGASSAFTPGGTATIRAWYPDGREYTNLIHTSRVRPDGSISWTWPCQGDPEGTYATEAVDDASHASTGRVTFEIGGQAVPPPPPPPPPATRAETTSDVPNKTFTNYTNAGGDLGPVIPPHSTLQIACKVQGFQVADGNTWWYRIASSPWNSAYYATADAFYNNGQTSGSLHGTPFVDNDVANC